MLTFLLVWGLCLATLAAALTLLHFIYRGCGTDLGLSTFGREAALALFVSAVQAGLYMLVAAVSSQSRGAEYALDLAILMVCYRAAHLKDMGWLEVGAVAIVQPVFFLLIWLTLICL